MEKRFRLWPTNATASFTLFVVVVLFFIGIVGGGLYFWQHRTPSDGFPLSITYNDRNYDRSGTVASEIPPAVGSQGYENVGKVNDQDLVLYVIPDVDHPAVIFAEESDHKFISYVLQGGP
jgi:hypothetical protein